MGARTVNLLCLSFLLPAFARADLQLTPRKSQYDVEGMKFEQLAFQDGRGKEVTYKQPPGWTYSGERDRLTLHPTNKTQCEATISNIPLREPGSFNEESLKKLTADAVAAAPKNGTDVRIVSQGKSSIKICGKESFQVVITYNLAGQSFTRSISYLNREREQLCFQLTARDGDFRELDRVFQASLCSWQNL